MAKLEDKVVCFRNAFDFHEFTRFIDEHDILLSDFGELHYDGDQGYSMEVDDELYTMLKLIM